MLRAPLAVAAVLLRERRLHRGLRRLVRIVRPALQPSNQLSHSELVQCWQISLSHSSLKAEPSHATCS